MAALLFVIATLAAPAAARLWERRRGAVEKGSDLEAWARFAYGVLPLFGAWTAGVVAGRDAGLTGIEPVRWLTGVAACAGVLGLLALGRRSPALAAAFRTWWLTDRDWLTLVDEPRWAFYRAAAAVLVPGPLLAQLVGLILGGAEWFVRHGRPRMAIAPAAWSVLVGVAVSAALFALTRNLWLVTAATALGRWMMLREWPERASEA